MAKKLRCYLGFHRWKRTRNDAGQWSARCVYCDKFSDRSERNVAGFGAP